MLRVSNHLALTVMIFTICACSIYRSPDRNNFDNDPFTGAPSASAQIVNVQKSSIPESAESAHCLLITKWDDVASYKSTPNLRLASKSTAFGLSRENGRARLEIARAIGSHLQSGLLCRLEFADARQFDAEFTQTIARAEAMIDELIEQIETTH